VTRFLANSEVLTSLKISSMQITLFNLIYNLFTSSANERLKFSNLGLPSAKATIYEETLLLKSAIIVFNESIKSNLL